jgi:hypothetical protein
MFQDFIAFVAEIRVAINAWTIISAFILLGFFKIVLMYFRAKLK